MSKRKLKSLREISAEAEFAGWAEDALYWAQANIHTVNNRPFSLDDYPFLVDIWQDENPVKSIKKGTQLAVSSTMVLKAGHSAYFKKRNQIYFFPTDEAVSSFVQGKVNPLVDENPALQAFIKKTDNIGQKQIGNATLYFRGMKSKSKLISVSGDDLTFDEMDFFPEPKSVELAEKRASDAVNPTFCYMGHPTIPNYGVSIKYDASDQKERLMKCPHCGRWNEPSLLLVDFPKCIEPGYLACLKCRLELDAYDSEWIPKFPDRTKQNSGYWIPRIISPKLNAVKLLIDFKEATDIQNFFNTELGLAYSDSESGITYGEVLALCGSYPMPELAFGTTCGVDVGKVLHVVISAPSKTAGKVRDYLWIGEVKGDGMKKWENLEILTTKLNCRKGMIDAKPDLSAAREFVKKKGKGWWINNYIESAHEATWNEDTQTMQINRTESLDSSHKLFRYGLINLPRRQYEIMDMFAKHCSNIAKQSEKNEKTGNVEYRWIETGADHFRHALNYDAMLWYTGKVAVAPTSGIRIPGNIRELLRKE